MMRRFKKKHHRSSVLDGARRSLTPPPEADRSNPGLSIGEMAAKRKSFEKIWRRSRQGTRELSQALRASTEREAADQEEEPEQLSPAQSQMHWLKARAELRNVLAQQKE